MDSDLLSRLESAAAGVTDLEPDEEFRSRARELLDLLHPATVRELSLALAVIDHPLAGLIWGNGPRRMRSEPPSARAARFRSMGRSRIPIIRSMSSAVRSAAAALLWSDAGRAAAIAPRESAER